ncbi:hypothetical protein AVEN_8884-1 [Araneus ventricosus]|uniref:Uncharacterized protein n=1 Tax=Araneus ventricosus TaxID=182803 RepID=A0A4Y2MTR8_ARAVE|nr:hypothetical protein AVEN_8884-1 [Araneus ventricosus]
MSIFVYALKFPRMSPSRAPWISSHHNSNLFPILGGTCLNLDIHHKAVPIRLEGFLADRFHLQPIKFSGSFTGRVAPTVSPSPRGNPIP